MGRLAQAHPNEESLHFLRSSRAVFESYTFSCVKNEGVWRPSRHLIPPTNAILPNSKSNVVQGQ